MALRGESSTKIHFLILICSIITEQPGFPDLLNYRRAPSKQRRCSRCLAGTASRSWKRDSSFCSPVSVSFPLFPYSRIKRIYCTAGATGPQRAQLRAKSPSAQEEMGRKAASGGSTGGTGLPLARRRQKKKEQTSALGRLRYSSSVSMTVLILSRFMQKSSC